MMEYKSLAARQAEAGGYGAKSYWDYLDRHMVEMRDKLIARVEHERAELMLTQSLGESLAGNNGD